MLTQVWFCVYFDSIEKFPRSCHCEEIRVTTPLLASSRDPEVGSGKSPKPNGDPAFGVWI